MTDTLAEHLIDVIDWHRTWIKAVDFGSYRRSVAVTDASVIRVLNPHHLYWCVAVCV